MTSEQRKLLTDAMDKSEDILVDLCCNKGVGWGSETYKDALVYLSRQLRILSVETLSLVDKIDGYERRISDLEKEIKMLVRG